MANEINVLGGPLKLCCGNGGFTREGFCYVPGADTGNHSVCAIVSSEFLEYSKQTGNDLSTPKPEYQFAGLNAGDRWCLCAERWEQARRAGVAPKVILDATNNASLAIIDLAHLKKHSHVSVD